MRPYQFQFSRSAENDFACFDPRLRQRIWSKLTYFEKIPNPLRFAKKLKGIENQFSFRIGDYRIIVSPREDGTLIILVILKIAHRRDVYED